MEYLLSWYRAFRFMVRIWLAERKANKAKNAERK